MKLSLRPNTENYKLHLLQEVIFETNPHINVFINPYYWPGYWRDKVLLKEYISDQIFIKTIKMALLNYLFKNFNRLKPNNKLKFLQGIYRKIHIQKGTEYTFIKYVVLDFYKGKESFFESKFIEYGLKKKPWYKRLFEKLTDAISII